LYPAHPVGNLGLVSMSTTPIDCQSNRSVLCLVAMVLAVAVLIISSPCDATSPAYSDDYQDYRGDAAKGSETFKICAACHSAVYKQNGIGPSLWGVVGRRPASARGFRYSAAMKARNMVWTQERLWVFVKSPRKDVRGTTCNFAGLATPQARANVVSYLATISRRNKR
jgi:cytochrome c